MSGFYDNFSGDAQTAATNAETQQRLATKTDLLANARRTDKTTGLLPVDTFSRALQAASQARMHDAAVAQTYYDMRPHDAGLGVPGQPPIGGLGMTTSHFSPAPAPLTTPAGQPNQMAPLGLPTTSFGGMVGAAQIAGVHPQTPGAPQQPADLTRYLAMQSGMSAPEFTAPVGSLSALRPDLFKHAFAQEQMLTDGQMGVPSQAVPAAAPATPPTPKPTDPTNPGFSTGTSRVPGKGSPKVDSVKANLAPDEAVLNAGAADHLGRPVIDALNAIGMAKMGMVPASTMDDRAQVQQAAQTAKGPDSSSTKDDRAQNPGFAKGTAKVGKGMPAGKAPDISQVDPRLLAAALQMGQGGAQGAPAGPPQGAGMM